MSEVQSDMTMNKRLVLCDIHPPSSSAAAAGETTYCTVTVSLDILCSSKLRTEVSIQSLKEIKQPIELSSQHTATCHWIFEIFV